MRSWVVPWAAMLALCGCRAVGPSDKAAARARVDRARAQAEAAMIQAKAASAAADQAAHDMAAARQFAAVATTAEQASRAHAALNRARQNYDRAEDRARNAAQRALNAEATVNTLEAPAPDASKGNSRLLHRARGEVEQVLPGQITVKTAGGEVALTTDADTRVQLDGQAIRPDQLPAGVEADVSYAPRTPLALARTIDARTRGAAPRAPPHVIRAPSSPPAPDEEHLPSDAGPASPNLTR